MTVSHRIAALIAALWFGSLVSASAAVEPVTWPPPWQPGQTWRYDNELSERETKDGATQVRRITDITEIAIERGSDGGVVQVWTSRQPRVEAIEGDRAESDMLAAMLGAFEDVPAEAEFDAAGRYRRLRNIETLTAKIREAMKPAAAAMAESMAAEYGQNLDEDQRAALIAGMGEEMQKSFDTLITPGTVEAITGSEIAKFGGFVGATLRPGKRYRDRAPLRTPIRGRALPANREYWIEIDREDPAYARVNWTHALDSRGDSDALWALVADLTAVDPKDIEARGRPRELSMREQGFVLFRRDTGAIELFQNVETARYADEQASERRTRMRREGAMRTWTEEDASGAGPDARK
jgi:hypothetical protein